MRQDLQATIVTQLLDNAPARKTLPETNATNPLPDTTTFLSLKVISPNFIIFNFYSDLLKAKVFGRSRSFSLFGLWLRPSKFNSKYLAFSFVLKCLVLSLKPCEKILIITFLITGDSTPLTARRIKFL